MNFLARALGWVASLFTGPILNRAFDIWQAKINAQTNGDKLAADLTIEAFRADIERRRIDAGTGFGWLSVCVMFFAIPTACYYAYALFNMVSGIGNTDPVRDPLIADIMRSTVQYVLPGGVGLKALSMVAPRLFK